MCAPSLIQCHDNAGDLSGLNCSFDSADAVTFEVEPLRSGWAMLLLRHTVLCGLVTQKD